MSENQWRYRVAGIDFGPVDFEGLAALAGRGQLSADDEVSRDGSSWCLAGEIVGLIPETVDDSCEFQAPKHAAADRRNSQLGESTLPPAEQATSAKPAPKAFKDEVNSLLSMAETASAEDIARSALSSDAMAISPQRGVRVQPKTEASSTANVVEPDEQPKAPVARDAASSLSATSKPAAMSSGAGHAAAQPASFEDRDQSSSSTPASTSDSTAVSSAPLSGSGFNSSGFNTGAASRPRPMIPQSKSSSFSMDGAVVAKIGGGLAAVVLLGAGLFFLPGLLSGMGAPDPDVTETDRLVEDVIGLAYLSGMEHPTQYITQLADQAKALESKIEQDGDPSIKPKLLAFHRDVLSRVFSHDGWNESNFTMLEKEWHAIRFELES